MKGYLDIKQTVEYINRTENTVRRVLIKKRDIINNKEGYKVIKYIDRKYYISTIYLNKRYNIDNTEITPLTTNTELQELKETVKMYAIMLEEKDKEIIRLKEENIYFKSQNEKITNSLITTLDQTQKLSALEKQMDILKLKLT